MGLGGGGDGRGIGAHEVTKELSVALALLDPAFQPVEVPAVVENADRERRRLYAHRFAIGPNFFDEQLLFHVATLGHLAIFVKANRPLDKWP